MDDTEQRRTSTSETGLSIDAFVGIGYSTLTILILFITMIVLPIIPTLVGLGVEQDSDVDETLARRCQDNR